MLVAIIDFGSQFTRLIHKCLGSLGVRSAIFPFSAGNIADFCPKAIILSGGPLSVKEGECPDIAGYLRMGLPVLAICYGMQAVSQYFGGAVTSGTSREFGETYVRLSGLSRLFKGAPSTIKSWMSHSDTVEHAPQGFSDTAWSDNGCIVAMEDVARSIYCVQFHPEVTHTEYGASILRNFAVGIAGCSDDWRVGNVAQDLVEQVRQSVHGRAVAAVSGGVDSSVAATLVHRAIGDRLTCVFVDTGLLRMNEVEQVKSLFSDHLRIPLTCIDASQLFIDRLAGVLDPELKRKIIGQTFIEVFENAVGADVEYLVQGTLYPDVVESLSGMGTVIKSHHNVGGLPEKMRLQLIEPLRYLFKDEVRDIGQSLGMPHAVIGRHPFPGPGLAIRIIGDVTRSRIEIIRHADDIFIQAIRDEGLYDDIWQALAVLILAKSVGVKGDGRVYENVCALRAIESVDGMTANVSSLGHEFLRRVATKIVNEVPGISRVVYDITSKPPASIEWE